MHVLQASRAHLALGVGASAVVAFGVVNAIPAAAAPESNLCPVSQMAKVWHGGTQDPWTFDHCGDLSARYDHLFYPGEMLSRDMAAEYVENVVVLQLRLGDLKYAPVAVDGHYGPQTESAVDRYQHNHGLVTDGKVGPQTWKALFGLVPA